MDFISSYGVQYKVEIDNFTNQPLILLKSGIKSGHVQKPPKGFIGPGSRECYNGHKMSWSPTGASGAVAYRIGSSNNVVAISITCPYTFILSSNTLALGFYQWDEAQIAKMPRNYIYNQMYRGEGPWKKSFYHRITPIHVNDEAGEYLVRGVMGTCHTPSVSISLYPTDPNRLAPKWKESLGHCLGFTKKAGAAAEV